MSIKDLFNPAPNSKNLANKSLEDIAEEAESTGYIEVSLEDRDRYVPQVDFSKPANFAKFGLAEKYYTDSIRRIYQEYPYDGSLKERLQFELTSSHLDNYIFENEYPRTNGYVNLGLESQAFGASLTIGDYSWALPAYHEFIEIKGGPNKDPNNTALKKIFPSDGGEANIYDVSENRESNLELDFANNGVTVEFWLNKQAFSTAKWKKEAIFDVWNGVATSSSDYGRLTIELSGTTASESPFYVTAQSGTAGAFNQQIGVSIAGTGSLTSWNHYAFSFVSASSGVETKFYVNGDLNQTAVLGASGIGEVTGSLIANIGCLRTPPSGNIYDISGMGSPEQVAQLNRGVANLSASMDEFRFWKTKRSSQQIGRHWFTQVGAGSNTDTANTDLGVYFKFNEGIAGNSSLDSTVLDYSGRISNGNWTGYSSNARSTGSAIVLAAAAATEFKDPIIRPSNPLVLALTQDKTRQGREHDHGNNSTIFYSIPGWILDTDGEDGDLRKLTQIMSSYFDDLYLQIQDLPNLLDVTYMSSSVSGAYKPAPFSEKMLKSRGMLAPDLFSNASILEQFLSRDEDLNFEDNIHNIKNIIYKNIYNNLSFIYKSKGTEKSFRNLIRCFGVDDELVKLNLYASDFTYTLDSNFKETSYRNTYVDFNDPSRFDATVLQYENSSNSNTTGFISGSQAESLEADLPFTIEAEVLFPKKMDLENNGYPGQYFETPFVSASLFGAHTVDPAKPTTDTIFASSDVCNFQVLSVRKNLNSTDAKFQLTSAAGGHFPDLISDFYPEVYNNQRWQLAVRMKPSKYPHIGNVDSTASPSDYEVSLYGVNVYFNTVQNEFEITGTISRANALSILKNPKRIFAGAHRQNFTGSILEKTDVKIGSVKVWYDYLSNESIKLHAIDPSNSGTDKSSLNAYLFKNNVKNLDVLKQETLLLNWDFETLTSSNTSGQMVVPDVSSGSTTSLSRHGWLGNVINRQHSGLGYGFQNSATASLDKDYIYTYSQQLPEILTSNDTVNILSQDDDVFTREHRPNRFYFSFEKSMYQSISMEMIKILGTIKDFNNLIGEPVNRYRPEYKKLGKLRQMFFERVRNTPDLQKYLEFYKWLDDSLSKMLFQLTPASSNVSKNISNVIESHILERNKYQAKFPTLESKTSDPESGLGGINEFLYDWRTGHAPIPLSENRNCLWWNKKAEREITISSGDTPVDSDRNEILSASLQVLNRKFTTPHRLLVDQPLSLKSGANSHQNKIRPLVRSEVFKASSNSLTGTFVDYFTDCGDPRPSNEKIRISLSVGGLSVLDGQAKGATTLPFSVHSSSANPNFAVATGKEITNLHSDFLETSMQGVFTKQHVGGSQHRNIGTINNLITGSNNSVLAREEAFRVKINGTSVIVHGADRDESGNINLHLPRANFFRDETAQRPFNIRNIKSSTSKGILGNYSSIREVVQTSSRRMNNKWFVYSGSADALASPSILFDEDSFKIGTGSVSTLESVEYSKPDRGRTEHVIVERFSAPGGPETAGDANGGAGLDALSAEYSINSTVNYRNPLVREVFNELSARHTNQFGINKDDSIRSADYNASASFHKINRNRSQKLKYGAGTSVATASMYDNLYIQRPVPQSDLGYAWISASAISSPLGYARDSRKLASDSEMITFLSSSENNAGTISVDFAGLNTYIYDEIDASQNLLSASSGQYRNTAFATVATVETQNALNLHRNGPYGYPLYKQIKTGGHPVARHQRKNNRLQYVKPAGPDQISRVTIGNQTYQVVLPQSDRIKTVVEPVLTSRYSPALHVLRARVSESPQSPEYKNLVFKHTIGNNLGDFANQELSNNLSRLDDGGQVLPFSLAPRTRLIYDDLKDLYVGGPTDPVDRFISLRVSETIYPKAANSFLERTRSRINYVTADVNKWRDVRADRTRYRRLNVFNNADAIGPADSRTVTSSIWPLDGPLDTSAYPKHASSSAASDLTGGLSGMGVLQNDYTTWHNGDIDNIKEAPTYSRKQLYYDIVPARVLTSGYAIWEAPAQAGKNPFFDSYDDFASDIKKIGKDFSIIPEFNISDHMDYYINANNGNFLAELPSGVFSLTGAAAESSGESTHIEGKTFFQLFNSTDFLKHFDMLSTDHEEYNKSLTLSCKAIKKFRPRDGFYPAQRTLQLATIFSQSYAASVLLTGSQGKLRTLMAPFFAPGIMYNTIKSGIAVDYPIMTGSFNTSAFKAGLHDGTSYSELNKWPPHVGNDQYLGAGGSSGATFGKIEKFHVISSSFQSRVPFEAIIDPDIMTAGSTVTITDAEPHPSASLDSTASFGGISNRLYKLAASNFFAETADFYLTDKKLGSFSSFVSKPSSKIPQPSPGIAYKMDVVLSAQSQPADIVPLLAFKYPTIFKSIAMYQSGYKTTSGSTFIQPCATCRRYDWYNNITTNLDLSFGPPVWEFSGSIPADDNSVSDRGVAVNYFGAAPFTPPYYDGPARVTLEFNPRRDIAYSVEKIIEELTSSYSRDGILNISSSPSYAYKSAMQISSSVSLAGIIKNKVIETDRDGNVVSIRSAEPSEGSQDSSWVIESKFETPILDFFNADVTTMTKTKEATPRGMWHQYGQIPDSTSKGIFLQISDAQAKAADQRLTQSLADLVGFPTEDRTKRMGEVAHSRKVSEAIVAIPFIRGGNGGTQDMTFLTFGAYTPENTTLDGRSLGDRIIDDALRGGVDGVATASDIDIVNKINKFVIPPRFDFVNNSSVDPIVMYIFDFNHEFSQQDLVDMWQNLPPDEIAISKNNIDQTTSTNSRIFTELEKLGKTLKDVQWMVFKAKQRASYNYFEKTLSTIDDDRGAALGAQDSGLKYSYNWPYDYFSLVELIKIDANMNFTSGSSAGAERFRQQFSEDAFDTITDPDPTESEQLGDVQRTSRRRGGLLGGVTQTGGNGGNNGGFNL